MMAAIPSRCVGAQLQVVSSERDFAALRTEWSGLLPRSRGDCLFLTWEWLHTWWRHLGSGRLSILALRRDGELAAIAPCLRRPAQWLRGRPLASIEFLGSGTIGSDYLDCIVDDEHEPELRDALAQSLMATGARVDWRQVVDGAAAARVVGCLSLAGWSAAERMTHTCPFIPLGGKSWEDYLAGASAQHRYNFNRKWKRLQRDYRVSFEEVREEGQRRDAIELVFQLHKLRWTGRGQSDAFHTRGHVEFHRELSRLALDRGWLRLYVLRLDDRPAACLYGFLYRGKFYFYQSGLDPAFEKCSAGMVLMGLAIRRAIEEGAGEFDLLHGTETYKSHWSRDSRVLRRLQAYPPGALAWLCRSSVDLEREARRIARQTLTGGAAA